MHKGGFSPLFYKGMPEEGKKYSGGVSPRASPILIGILSPTAT
jgi:hypothetical protein